MFRRLHLQDLKTGLEEMLEKPLVKGDKWYLIEKKWFQQLKSYIGIEDGDLLDTEVVDGSYDLGPIPLLGPVDNKPLFQEDGMEIREHMIDELDYFLVPEEAWVLLVYKFSIMEGQEPIERKVVEHGMFVKYCKVEVYLMKFELAQNNNIEDTRMKKFSKSDTIEQIENVMRAEFNISGEAVTRMWNNCTSNTYEQLSELDKSVLDAGLFSGQLIIIEIKNKDGTWPGHGHRQRRVKRSSDDVHNVGPENAGVHRAGTSRLNHIENTATPRLDTSRLNQIAMELENIQTFESSMDASRKALNENHKSEINRIKAKQKQESNDFENNCATKIKRKKELVDELQGLQTPFTPPPSAPECPICLESMSPPTQIFNCPNGHLVCGLCKPRVPTCNLCRMDYMGRATAMEQMLRDIFKTK